MISPLFIFFCIFLHKFYESIFHGRESFIFSITQIYGNGCLREQMRCGEWRLFREITVFRADSATGWKILMCTDSRLFYRMFIIRSWLCVLFPCKESGKIAGKSALDAVAMR